MKILRNLILFIVVYFTMILLLGVLPLMKNQKTIQMTLNNSNTKPGTDQSNTLGKFREIYNYSDVDILVVGSSHAIYNIDPRAFQLRGLKIFNLGTAGQSPLNSYFLLKEFLPQLNPKMVIFEIFPGIMSANGWSSFVNLAVNRKPSYQLFLMGLNTKNIQFLNIFSISIIQNLLRPLNSIIQSDKYAGHRSKYVEGGGVLILDENFDFADSKVQELILNNRQLYYFNKSLELIKNSNIDCKLITTPLVNSDTRILKNYYSIQHSYKKVISKYGFEYIDYNESIQLGETYYNDWGHFNYKGASRFSRLLVNDIRKSLQP